MSTIPAIVAKTPAPLRLPFVRGQEVVTRYNGAKTKDRVRQVINVDAGGEKIRYYALDSEPDLLIPADCILHTWEA